jgi:hypothetical protein
MYERIALVAGSLSCAAQRPGQYTKNGTRMSTFTSEAEIEKMVRSAIFLLDDAQKSSAALQWLDQRIAGYDASKKHFVTMVGVLSGLDLNKQSAIELPDLSEEPPPIDDSEFEDDRYDDSQRRET